MEIKTWKWASGLNKYVYKFFRIQPYFFGIERPLASLHYDFMNKKLKFIGTRIQKFLFYREVGESVVQEVILYVTPGWFKLLGWLFMLGALHFISIKTGSIIIGLLYKTSLLAMFFYLFTRFDRFDRSFIRRIAPIVSFLLSLILMLLIYFFLDDTVRLIELLQN